MLPQILGFFCAGVVLNQFGLIRNLTDVKLLSEWGILFLVGTILWSLVGVIASPLVCRKCFTRVIDSPLCLPSAAV